MSKHGKLTSLTAEDVTIPRGHSWRLTLPLGLLGLGVVFLAISYGIKGGSAAASKQFNFAYLVAFSFWLTIALGAWFFVLFNHAARAGWNVVVRRVAESLMLTLPLFAILFIPIVMGMGDLYLHHWADPHPMVKHKAAWLNKGFWLTRAYIYFGVWTLCALFFWWQSVKQDQTGDKQITRRLQGWANPAIALFAVSVSFAAFDWLMALDPHWFSTIYGVYYFAGCLIAIFSALILITEAMNRTGVIKKKIITVEHFHDMGKYLFAFSIFWSYIAFSQFMLQWYANIPEETMFYAKRWFVVDPNVKHWEYSNWKYVSIFLAAGHFGVPFLFLMSQWIKRKSAFLIAGSIWMLFMHLLDTFWLVMPNVRVNKFSLHAVDFTTVIGVGGIFLGVFFFILSRRPVVPTKDPRLAESLQFENVTS